MSFRRGRLRRVWRLRRMLSLRRLNDGSGFRPRKSCRYVRQDRDQGFTHTLRLRSEPRRRCTTGTSISQTTSLPHLTPHLDPRSPSTISHARHPPPRIIHPEPPRRRSPRILHHPRKRRRDSGIRSFHCSGWDADGLGKGCDVG